MLKLGPKFNQRKIVFDNNLHIEVRYLPLQDSQNKFENFSRNTSNDQIVRIFYVFILEILNTFGLSIFIHVGDQTAFAIGIKIERSPLTISEAAEASQTQISAQLQPSPREQVGKQATLQFWYKLDSPNANWLERLESNPALHNIPLEAGESICIDWIIPEFSCLQLEELVTAARRSAQFFR